MIRKQINKYKMTWKEFGLSYAFTELLLRCVGKFAKNSKVWRYISRFKYERITQKLTEEFLVQISEYQEKRGYPAGNIEENAPIWFYWSNGTENAPDIVKDCLDSAKKLIGEHKVVEIDYNNYCNYVEIPYYIVEKYEKGIISRAHFSDVLRFTLLSAYGGIWMDATIFFSDENALTVLPMYNFFTVKHMMGEGYLACRGKWSTFFLASAKDNIYMSFIRDCLLQYWKVHSSAIDYLFLDSIIGICYDNFNLFKYMVEKVPVNNMGTFDLMQFMMKEEESGCVDVLLQENAIHKLTYKYEYAKRLGAVYYKVVKSQK